MELLERTPYLEEMQVCLQRAIGGEGRLLLLGGEAGVGKTVLVEWFCHLSRRVARILIGACDPLSTPRPLGPFLDVASELGPNAERLFTEGVPPHQLFRGVLNALSNSSQPTILVIEDAHWADEATLDALRFLARRIQPLRCMIIVTYRDDEVGSRHPLRVLMGDIATGGAVRRMALPVLTEQGVARIAKGSLVDPVKLYRLTGGNPFYVTEVLAIREPGVPRSVRDAVLARASRLSDAARSVLDATAVAGTTIPLSLLEQIIDIQTEFIDECVESGILRMHEQALAFRHELGREAIADAVPPSQRAATHGRVLNALRSDPTTSREWAQLAHHVEAAGDHEAVITYAPAAADEASAQRAHRQSVAQYARALRCADSLPPKRHAELLGAFAYECYLTDQLAPGIDALQKALEIWQREGERAQEGASLRWLSRLYWIAGQNVQAKQAAADAIAVLEQLPPSCDLAMAYSNQAQLQMLARDMDRAIIWGGKAIALAEQIGDVETLIHALNNVGTATLLSGSEGGRPLLERSLHLAVAEELEDHAARAYTNLGSSYGEIYQFGRATSYLREGISYCLERDLDYLRTYMTAWLSLVYCYQGRWDDSLELATSVLKQSNVSTVNRIMALTALSRTRARRGDREMHQILEEALALALPTGDLQRIGPVRAARAEAAWLAGDLQGVIAEGRIGFELAQEYRHSWLVGEFGMWRWLAGDLDTVPENAADPFARQVHGDWQGAAEAWTRLGCPYEAAQARASSANPAVVRQALSDFLQLNARPAAAMTTRRLRELGVLEIPRGPRSATRANPAGLTSREVDVLTYMAEGQTNVDIAAHLYLSIKTVEHHASSIYQKLGVASRREAIRTARDLSLIPQDTGFSAPN